ncbi:MAG: hypothetical protein HETSPECPRED_007267 [Heterodermia speciosa]|uniref:7alpha-cephem-methoxylase P8 chain n=1 Tax=Heterodermia speciosa TaxID=116794 RepID=A0A8H3FPY8_9LECA|nr:MAG: hypothetical protein HETSPECPRED_007267 [Heterodermia speciosa]
MASTLLSDTATAPHLLNPSITVPSPSPSPTTTPKPTPRNIPSAAFHYYLDPGDGSLPPPNYVNNPVSYERPVSTHSVPVRDIRGNEARYTLDSTGFQIWEHGSALEGSAWVDEGEIKEKYYKEVEGLLKDATGASKIFIFDHTIRRPQPGSDAKDAEKALRGPVQRVHIDQSYKAGPQRVQHHLPDEAERLLKGRYQIINVWRPIKTIRKDPLGVADATSVPDSDLVPVQLVYPDRVGETYTVRPNPDHRWFYLSEQTPREVLLIKCFDSKVDGRARRVPHSAFVDEANEGESPRESIEVRALVFHPDDVE